MKHCTHPSPTACFTTLTENRWIRSWIKILKNFLMVFCLLQIRFVARITTSAEDSLVALLPFHKVPIHKIIMEYVVPEKKFTNQTANPGADTSLGKALNDVLYMWQKQKGVIKQNEWRILNWHFANIEVQNYHTALLIRN